MLISPGIFNSQLTEIESILKKLEMDRERNIVKDSFDVSKFRHKNYLDNWKEYIKNNLYDFLLFDSSIIIFKNEKRSISYIFFECPFECLTYEEFCQNNNINFYDDYFEHYLEYLDTCSLKEFPVMFRYDYDDSSYVSGYHPVSHIHIGFNNNIRIGTEKKLNTITFFLFTLRQHYNKKWLKFISSEFFEKKMKSSYPLHKNRNHAIDVKFWKDMDKGELYFI